MIGSAVGIGIVLSLNAGWNGLISFVLAGIVLWSGAGFILRRIPGLTGDSYGALCEITELTTLIFFTIGLHV